MKKKVVSMEEKGAGGGKTESEVTFRRNQEYSLLLLHAQKALPPDSEKQ